MLINSLLWISIAITLIHVTEQKGRKAQFVGGNSYRRIIGGRPVSAGKRKKYKYSRFLKSCTLLASQINNPVRLFFLRIFSLL